MENKMTELSAAMYSKAVHSHLSVDDAVDMLRKCTDFRTLSQKLQAFSKGRDIKEVLIAGLSENHPDVKKDSISKKVRNWLNDRQNTLHKEDAIELCFILNLTLDESDAFVAMICEEALHWRNLDEIPYIFALSKNMSYKEAVELHDKIKNSLSKSDNKSSDEAFTDIVKSEIRNIENEEELISYVINTKHKLGNLHNTAYELFNTMMGTLENPTTELVDDDDYFPKVEKYSVEKIVQAYLHRKDIPKVEDNNKSIMYSALQRSIIQNWPNETVLSHMKNRHTDVTRKVLMLLFLATFDSEGYMSTDDGYDEDYLYPELGYEKNNEEIFKEFYNNMNIILESSGFRTLDPRSPFDWIIIFCMCVENSYDEMEEDFDVDGTLSEFLQLLFPDEKSGN